jgi:hypothetical protein
MEQKKKAAAYPIKHDVACFTPIYLGRCKKVRYECSSSSLVVIQLLFYKKTEILYFTEETKARLKIECLYRSSLDLSGN